MNSLLSLARVAAGAFAFGRTVEDIRPFGSGLINNTFLVRCGGSYTPQFILQRLNRRVFTQPERVMSNLEMVLAHTNLRHARDSGARTLHFPVTARTHTGATYYVDDNRDLWRAASFIPNTVSRDQIQNRTQAREIGFALGRFHCLLADLPPHHLHDTLPGFHVTPLYLQQYDQAPRPPVSDPDLDAFCHEFIAARRSCVPALENELARGTLRLRVIHGDPKVNNFLFSDHGDEVVSIIDLDTVKPGLVHYDLGDCLRSACNRAGEDPPAGTPINYDVEVAAAILEGYLGEARTFMTTWDFDLCYTAMRLIPLELGIRFFADYLHGNKYFRVTDPAQNRRRALTQFRLVESIERQSIALEELVEHSRHTGSPS